MSWDRKADRKNQYAKRKKAKTNSKNKRYRKGRKEELKYQEGLKNYD